MPTYEYKCSACGNRFERFQSITAPPIRKCPACGKNRVERLIGTGAGLIFKGSGFYITDYRSEGYKEKAKAESGGGESKSEGKSSETKPAGSSDSAATQTKAAAKSESAVPSKSESAPAPKSPPRKR